MTALKSSLVSLGPSQSQEGIARAYAISQAGPPLLGHCTLVVVVGHFSGRCALPTAKCYVLGYVYLAACSALTRHPEGAAAPLLCQAVPGFAVRFRWTPA